MEVNQEQKQALKSTITYNKVARTNGKVVLIKRNNGYIEPIKSQKREEYIVDNITENYLKNHINAKKKQICEGRKKIALTILQSFLWAGFNPKRTNLVSISGFRPCYK